MNKKNKLIYRAVGLICSMSTIAHSIASDTIAHQEVFSNLQEAFSTQYVLPEKAKQVNELLNDESFRQKFAHYDDKKLFVKELTSAIQTVLNDKHFRVIVPRSRPSNENNNLLENHLAALTQFRQGGFKDISFFEGNVGYVRIDGFRAEDQHQVDGLMTYFRTADAIIIDLRENGGGGKPVNYLSSYFLPDDTLIGKTYHRSKDVWLEHKSEHVKGEKRFDVPLFILTSDFTFSAAEAFAYNLQAIGRAKIVGEISGGGAHPITFLNLSGGIATIMPNRRSYNTITKTNWEGTGVIPDYQTDKEATLSKAKLLAKTAALKYRTELFDELETYLIDKCQPLTKQRDVNEIVSKLLHRKHIEQFMVVGFAERLKSQGNHCGATLLENANQALLSS